MQGIKFNEQGTKGILNGSKTMTRRPLSEQQIFERMYHMSENDVSKYKIGEVIFVQEPFLGINYLAWIYKYDNKHTTFEGGMRIPWCSANEMPHYASRIKIKITGIKVERLQDISEEDCIKEGIILQKQLGHNDMFDNYSAIELFKGIIWDKLPYRQPYNWDSNPYVFVYEFEVIK